MKPIMKFLVITFIPIISGIVVFNDLIIRNKDYNNFENFMEQEIPELMKTRGVMGASIAIIKNGEISQIRTYGYADKENHIKNSSEKRFRIASLSKPMTAWGIMKLVQDGKLDLHKPVEDYLIRWKFPESDYDTKAVTAERLLTHNAGVSVPSYGGYPANKKRTTIIG